MLPHGLVLFLLIALSISVQADYLNTYLSKGFENGYPTDPVRQLVENRIQYSLPNLNLDQPASSSPCVGVRPNTKISDPTDKTRYYQCRRDLRYEIYTCPNGGIFDDVAKACIDLCEQQKPCLNNGQCIILSNLTLQCICRQDWTGERCEVPLSSCVNKPCGPNAECRMLKSIDYTQDYVCICNNQQGYGRNCQQTVPNPCLSPSQQFHPFAFSRHAYINCDGERIFFQPCNSILYWNQEQKRCDRTLPEIFKIPYKQWQNQQIDTTIQQQPLISQFERNQQLSQNNQQKGTSNSISNLNIGQSQRIEENQQQQQQQQNFAPPTTREQKQGLSAQQWRNLLPDFNTQKNQRFAVKSQPWQGSQTIQNQPEIQSQSQPSLTDNIIETTTAPPRIFHLQGFATQYVEERKPQWQNNADNQIQSSVNLNTQSAVQPQLSVSFNTQPVAQPQSSQGSSLGNNQLWSQGQNQQTAELTSQRQQEKSQENQISQSVDFKTVTNQAIVTQPNPWSGTLTVIRQQNRPETQQTNDLTSQSLLQNQNQQKSTTETISQVGKTSSQNILFRNNKQSWQHTPTNQLLNPQDESIDFNIQTNQKFPAQSQSRTDSSISFPLETTTMSNAGVQPDVFIKTLRGWDTSPQDSIQTSQTGSWRAG